MADDQTRYINPALWVTPAASELTDTTAAGMGHVKLSFGPLTPAGLSELVKSGVISAKERTELMVIQAEKLTTKGEPSG